MYCTIQIIFKRWFKEYLFIFLCLKGFKKRKKKTGVFVMESPQDGSIEEEIMTGSENLSKSESFVEGFSLGELIRRL